MNTFIPTLKTIDDCIQYAQAINPKKAPLTPEQLRQFPGCERYSEEQAAQLVQTIDLLVTAVFETVTIDKEGQSENTAVIPIEKNRQPFLSPNKQNAA